MPAVRGSEWHQVAAVHACKCVAVSATRVVTALQCVVVRGSSWPWVCMTSPLRERKDDGKLPNSGHNWFITHQTTQIMCSSTDPYVMNSLLYTEWNTIINVTSIWKYSGLCHLFSLYLCSFMFYLFCQLSRVEVTTTKVLMSWSWRKLVFLETAWMELVLAVVYILIFHSTPAFFY